MDILEKIDDWGVPRDDGRFGKKVRPFKFRISYRLWLRGDAVLHAGEFCYFDLVAARRCYRDILLGLYRGREVVGFEICLNRVADVSWVSGILREGGDSIKK